MSLARSDEQQEEQSEAFLSHDGNPVEANDNLLTGRQAWCLYVSHFLSMWNSRTYEYAAVSIVALQRQQAG